MCIAEARTSPPTALLTMYGDAMRRMMLWATIWYGAVSLLVGCATSPTHESDAKDCTARVAQALSQREAELASARADVAIGKIAAAKQAAELQELRNLVSQLRQENTASHQAVTRLQQEVAASQEEIERMRHTHDQAEQSKQAQHLTNLERTMTALTQELDHLKQDIQLTITNAVINRKETPSSGTARNKGNPLKQSQTFGAVPQKGPSSKVEPIGLSLGTNGSAPRDSEGTVQPGGYSVNPGSSSPGEARRTPTR